VRLVGDNVEPAVINIAAALSLANELELDLVEISPKAKQSKVVVKEIRLGPNTDEHDFLFKLKHGRKFLEDGAKLKAYVFFRGRTIVFKERGEILLLKFATALEDVGTVEQMPKLEGKRMTVMFNPKKK
jgi:translation initiation factor IF-3